MNEEERKELLWRQITEKVVEGVDKQIKRKYFWAALLFAMVSWLGGSAIITGIVQSRVAEKMEPAQTALAQAKLLTDQLSESLKESQKNATKLSESLKDMNTKAESAEKRLSDSVKDMETKVESAEKRLQTLQSSTALAINQSNESIALLKRAVTEPGQADKTEVLSKLETPRVIIRVTGVPVELAKQVIDKIASTGKYSLSVEGGAPFIGSSGLRYFYPQDADLARGMVQAANEALGQAGVSNKTIPVVDLTGLSIKPSPGAFELWLNMSDGRLL